MVLPGWNASEPVELAVKLYHVVESFKSAPEESKSFVSKVNSFSRSLNKLQKTLDDAPAIPPPSTSSQSLDDLKATLEECKSCVAKCEAFAEHFQKLTRTGGGGGGGLASAGQASKWVWRDKESARLRQEIDSQMASIGLNLTIETTCVFQSPLTCQK